ncbi:MAG: 50S ribosomal protein L25 [Candidatus Gracilibacteria bacterium]
MENIVLPVQMRNAGSQAAKDLRTEKQVPAVIYGHKKENIHISVDAEKLRKVYRHAGRNTIVTLELDGGKTEKVLIHMVDRHPVKDTFMHVDFYAVKLKEKITTTIPLEFTGISNAVKNFGGIFVETMSEVEVRCLPTDLIHTIVVDIAVLENFGDSIHVSDLIVPKTIEILTGEEETIALVQAPKEEVVANEAPSADQLVPESAKDSTESSAA